jgi:hypothetical protein
MMANAFRVQSPVTTDGTERYMLWIDGVGAYLVCLAEEVTIGGPNGGGNGADISLLANLSRKHATIIRTREGYVFQPHAESKAAGRPVHDRAPLNSGYTIELAGCVKLQFRQPSVLSATAVLEFVSEHRPTHSVDAVVLMDETCLLGPGQENHVRCPDWSETVVLFHRNGQFHCKSRADLFVDGDILQEGTPLEAGAVVSGPDLRFRLEAV